MDPLGSAKSLSSAFWLADLFSDCVEAINLVHGTHEEDHEEEILTAQLGIEQARLLIFGDVVGICSPPASTAISHAVPKHPGALNPEPEKALFFVPRDIRLDDQRFRERIENALKAISHPMTHLTKVKVLHQYGLDLFNRSPKVREGHQLAPNAFRLQAFREKLELLGEVTEDYPHASVRRHLGVNKKLAWSIQDTPKARELVSMIREKVDYLVQLMDTQGRVDRSMKQDIRAMGWHPGDDMQATIRDTLKLSLIFEASEAQYPEYSSAAQEAIDNITGGWRGTHAYDVLPDHMNPTIHKTASHAMLAQPLPSSSTDAKPPATTTTTTTTITTPARANSHKRKSKLLGSLRPKLTRLFSAKGGDRPRPAAPLDPSRSRSDAGNLGDWTEAAQQDAPGDPQRSKSLANDDLTHVLTHSHTLESMISRHDQYPGLNRVETLDNNNARRGG